MATSACGTAAAAARTSTTSPRLTRAQALELIASREPVCLRIYRRPDGTVVTNDCWSRLRAARRRGMWAFVAMLATVRWVQLVAMFVGIASLMRLVLRPATGTPAVAPVTAGEAHHALRGAASSL